MDQLRFVGYQCACMLASVALDLADGKCLQLTVLSWASPKFISTVSCWNVQIQQEWVWNLHHAAITVHIAAIAVAGKRMEGELEEAGRGLSRTEGINYTECGLLPKRCTVRNLFCCIYTST